MCKLMLMDDDEVIVELLRTLLKIEGFDVVAHPPQGDILQPIRDEHPDVILMDVYLKTKNGKKLDGLTVLRELRADPDLADTKVIMSSGLDFHIESGEGGADGFITNPICLII